MTLPGQTHVRRSRQEVRAEIEQALLDAQGDVDRAAARVGCSVPTFYQRARRCGVSVAGFRWQVLEGVAVPTPASGPAPPAGDAVLTEAGVTLSLADYATLQTEAAMGREAARLEAALDAAERVIAALTRNLEDMGRRAA